MFNPVEVKSVTKENSIIVNGVEVFVDDRTAEMIWKLAHGANPKSVLTEAKPLNCGWHASNKGNNMWVIERGSILVTSKNGHNYYSDSQHLTNAEKACMNASRDEMTKGAKVTTLEFIDKNGRKASYKSAYFNSKKACEDIIAKLPTYWSTDEVKAFE